MKKSLPLLFLFLLLTSQYLPAQEVALRSVGQAQQELRSSLPTTWQLPNSSECITIQWQARRSSFANEGIQTFVAYAGEHFVGTAALQGQAISGQIAWKGTTYDIITRNNQLFLQTQADVGHCGTCCQHHSDAVEAPSLTTVKNSTSTTITWAEEPPQLYSDGVLRVYRLALMVEYNMFVSTFNSSIQRVKQFWATTETTLNEIYLRDVGVQFQVINNNHLIRKTAEEEFYSPSSSASSIISSSTLNLNSVIGENNYDAGVIITQSASRVSGLAALSGVYSKGLKGYAMANSNVYTIGHEIGHLFGADHTFTSGGDYTMKTEPGAGTSIMSYGMTESRDFFSLACIWYIKNSMLNSLDYYTTPERTTMLGPNNADNIPYGIPTNNRAPVIDRTKIAPSYRIPKHTEFQFRIPAVDPDGDPLYYVAHQTDIRRYNSPSNARFRSYKPSRNNVITYQPTYNQDDGSVLPYSASDQYPEQVPIGTYTFWLSAYDGLSSSQREQRAPHATCYDMVRTTVEIAEGTPFKFAGLSKPGTPLRRGEKRVVKWNVDPNFFPEGSKVRILLSDDLGHNFPYVLEESTDNDGEHEVIIPYIEPKSVKKFGEKLGDPAFYSSSSLVFKIEVIDHIAHAISNNNIRGGGLELTNHRYVVFTNPPSHAITVPAGQALPAALNVTANDGKGKALSVAFTQEEISPRYFKRMWTAKNGESVGYLVQHVYIEQPMPQLQFVGNLPTDMQLTCVQDIPERIDPQFSATPGSNAQLHFEETRIKGDEPNYTVRRIWTLTADYAQPISHTQTIIVHDYSAPEFSDRPANMVVRSVNEIPKQADLIAVDNCDGQVTISPSSSIIWDSQNGRDGGRIYRWLAQDARQQQNFYEQYIFVDYDGTLVKTNVAALQSELAYKSRFCIARISDLIVTYNDGWKAYLEDNTGGILVRGLPRKFKAGDRLTDGFELVLAVGNGADKYNRDIFEYKSHAGDVKASQQELPLTRVAMADLLARPNDYKYRRVLVEGTTEEERAFNNGRMTLRNIEKTAEGASMIAIRGEFATPIAASRVPLAVIGYYATQSSDGPFLDVVQQEDIWGKLSVSPHKFATYFSNAPLYFPQQLPSFADSNGPLRAAIITDATSNGQLATDYRFLPGSLVPSLTPILVQAEEGEHYYNFTIETPDALEATNYLRGSLTTQTFTAQSGEKFYHLTNTPSFGFYWQHGTNGDRVVNNAGKCFLALPFHLASSSQGFHLDEGHVTTIDTQSARSATTEMYDLSGRRVQPTGNGVYLSQGQKIIR